MSQIPIENDDNRSLAASDFVQLDALEESAAVQNSTNYQVYPLISS
jgi:hypothetical protein